MNHRVLQRVVGFMVGFGVVASAGWVFAQLAEPTDADKLSYLVKGKMNELAWPNHGWIEERYGQPETKTAEQIDQDISLFMLQRAFAEKKIRDTIVEARKLAQAPNYHNHAVLRAIKIYSVAAEKNVELDEVRRMENDAYFQQEGESLRGPLAVDDPELNAKRSKFFQSVRGQQFRLQREEIETRFRDRTRELFSQPLTGQSPNTREITRLEERFREEKKFLDEIYAHLEKVRGQKVREEADREFQVWTSAKDVQLQAGQASNVIITVNGGTPPYTLRATTSENEQLDDGSISASGGSRSVPLRFPSRGNRSVFVVVEDSGPPGQQKRGGVTVVVQVSGPPGAEKQTPSQTEPAPPPGPTEPPPKSPPPTAFAPCVTPGSYRAYFIVPAWDLAWGIELFGGLTDEAKKKEAYQYLPDCLTVSVTIEPSGRISGDAQAAIPDEDFEHDSREWAAKGETHTWSYSFHFDGTVDFATGKTEIRVTNGRSELSNRNQKEDGTTEQRRDLQFDAVLRGWMVPGPDDTKRIPEFYAALLRLPAGQARQDLAALTDSTPTDEENEIMNMLNDGPWPRLKREADGRVVFADCGFAGATVPGDGSAVSITYSKVAEEDIGYGGDFFGAMREMSTGKPTPDSEVRDKTAEQQQDFDAKAAGGKKAWSLRLIGPAPASAPPAASTPAEMVAFGIWPPEEPIRVTLDRADKTIQLDAIGAMSGNTVEIKDLTRQGRWKAGDGLTSLGQGRFRIDSPGLHRVRVEKIGSDGYRWTATKEILVTEPAAMPTGSRPPAQPPAAPPPPPRVASFSDAAAADTPRIQPAPGSAATETPQVLFTQAQEAVNGRRFDEAEQFARQALAQAPDDAQGEGNNMLGYVLHMAGRYSDAEVALRQAVAQRPDFAFYQYNLASTLFSQQKYVEAERVSRVAVALDPASAPSHNGLGNALQHQGKHAEAEMAYREAIRIDPSSATYWDNLGGALYFQQKNAEGERIYRDAIGRLPDSALCHNGLGIALHDQGKYAPAESSFREAVRLDPNFAAAQANLAGALWNQHRTEEAASAARLAMDLGQSEHWVYEKLRTAPAAPPKPPTSPTPWPTMSPPDGTQAGAQIQRKTPNARVASQSSTYYGCTAERAIDGITDGRYDAGSLTHTACEDFPWWQLDLGQTESVAQVTLVNRTDCCGERLADLYLMASEQPFSSNDPATTQGQSGVWSLYLPGEAGPVLTIDVGQRARYLRVQLAGKASYLSLAEVEVSLGSLPPP